MVDKVDSITRSRIMAAVKSKNTSPELLVRSILHKKGFRFRLHVKNLPGKPDIVFPKYHAVIFIHGCFWHGHENCRMFRLPHSRIEFWQNKITRNKSNDIRAIQLLRKSNWRVCIVWECKIQASKKNLNQLADVVSSFLNSEEPFLELTAI